LGEIKEEGRGESMKKIVLVLLAMVMLGGCSTPSKTVQLTESDYGSYPSNYEQIVKKYFEMRLSDPSSAQYHFSASPSKGYTRKVPIDGGDIDKVGWIVVVLVNASDRMGGNGRGKKYTLLINNDRVIEEISPNRSFSEWWYR
jgi:hypothetical protein